MECERVSLERSINFASSPAPHDRKPPIRENSASGRSRVECFLSPMRTHRAGEAVATLFDRFHCFDQRNVARHDGLVCLARLIDDAGDSPSHLCRTRSIGFTTGSIEEQKTNEPTMQSVDRIGLRPIELVAIRGSLSCDTIERFHIPSCTWHDLVEGVRQDMQGPVRIETREALERYCYHGRFNGRAGLFCRFGELRKSKWNRTIGHRLWHAFSVTIYPPRPP